MVYQGTIQNGVVVFGAPVPLADGTPVNVVVGNGLPSQRPAAEDDPLFDMSELAVDMGINDLGANIDHYLYGHPKVDDGR